MKDEEFKTFLKEIEKTMKEDPSTAKKILRAAADEIRRKRLLRMQGKEEEENGN